MERHTLYSCLKRTPGTAAENKGYSRKGREAGRDQLVQYVNNPGGGAGGLDQRGSKEGRSPRMMDIF